MFPYYNFSFFNMAPEARALFQRVDGNNTNSPNFIAHGLRIIAAADIIIDNLDQPGTVNAELAHLKKQHAPRKIPVQYFQVCYRLCKYGIHNLLNISTAHRYTNITNKRIETSLLYRLMHLGAQCQV